MNQLARSVILNVSRTMRRTMSSEGSSIVTKDAAKAGDAAVTKAIPPQAPPKVETVVSKDRSSFSERLGSFLAGLGLGLGVSFYFLHEELKESNEKFDAQLKSILGKN